ncbi:translation initiation factor IF-2-like [Choloepus didactylus]|uniref:translation initiation factor IF-2-like n=1 Tax=Choloepus didactylus TaxID=27675 RepID=UPI00189D9658|nr:translation initiation factor IF-2-like [Choloepus didactylus]
MTSRRWSSLSAYIKLLHSNNGGSKMVQRFKQSIQETLFTEVLFPTAPSLGLPHIRPWKVWSGECGLHPVKPKPSKPQEKGSSFTSPPLGPQKPAAHGEDTGAELAAAAAASNMAAPASRAVRRPAAPTAPPGGGPTAARYHRRRRARAPSPGGLAALRAPRLASPRAGSSPSRLADDIKALVPRKTECPHKVASLGNSSDLIPVVSMWIGSSARAPGFSCLSEFLWAVA